MKPVNVKANTYIDVGVNSDKDPIFEFVDHLRTSNCEIFLQKVTLNIDLKRFLQL